MENFVDTLKDLIIDDGNKSLRELERLTGIGSSQWSKYLNGRIPSIDVCIRMADYFNVSVDYIFNLTDSKNHKNYKDKNLSMFLPRYEEVLKRNNTTNWKFCKENGLNESNWRHWKNGSEPRVDTLRIIADKLSTSIDYLIGRF